MAPPKSRPGVMFGLQFCHPWDIVRKISQNLLGTLVTSRAKFHAASQWNPGRENCDQTQKNKETVNLVLVQ